MEAEAGAEVAEAAVAVDEGGETAAAPPPEAAPAPTEGEVSAVDTVPLVDAADATVTDVAPPADFQDTVVELPPEAPAVSEPAPVAEV